MSNHPQQPDPSAHPQDNPSPADISAAPTQPAPAAPAEPGDLASAQQSVPGTPSTPAGAPPARQLGCGHYAGMLIILAGLVALLFVQTCTTIAVDAASKVASIFEEAFKIQPQIRYDERIVSTQTTDISELAIVSKEQSVGLKFTADWRVWNVTMPLTTKTITVEADYKIKAGFNLSKPFIVWIDEDTGRIRAELPRAELLSIERLEDSLRLSDESAWFNSVQPTEREKILNDLDKAARVGAFESGLLRDAEERAEKRLNEIAERNGEPGMRILWRAPND